MDKKGKIRKNRAKKRVSRNRQKKSVNLVVDKKTAPGIKKEPLEKIHKTKIRVIGIGGGGSSIVAEIASRVKKADFFVANTDSRALRGLGKKVKTFQFGQEFTKGLGTGMNSEIAKIAAQDEKERIKKILQGQDLCVIIACLGGGTGSGAAPVFAKISKDLGNLTYGIFTLPFKFEGEKKSQIAQDALLKLKPSLNAFSVIPNERIFQTINKETPLRVALSIINKRLAENLEGLIETVYEPGLINIDFADLKTVFEGYGKLSFLNTMELPGLDKKEEIIEKIIFSPLYSYGVNGAKGVLLNISGEKSLSLSDVSQISKAISDSVNSEAKIIFGISHEKKYQNKVKVTLLATGCNFRNFIKKPREKSIKKKKRKKTAFSKETVKTNPIKGPEKQKISPEKTKQKNKKKSLNKKKKKPQVKSKKITNIPVLSKSDDYQKQWNIQEEDEKTRNKIRRNGLQIKKEIKEVEKELLEQEKKWELPAFLRKKSEKND